jgi:predicted membrane channel-forming protein YqfA (hemolysin III family)
MENQPKISGAGGTPGGIVEFFVGLGMAVAGAYLLTNQVTVTSGFWSIWGRSAFGLTLLPLIFGIGILFFNGKSIVGWLLLFAGVIIIFAGIITNLQIYFQPTSLFNTIMMLVLLAGGIGLVARSLAAHR